MSLRQVTADDARFLYDLLAERPEHANISHKRMPTYEEHLEFIKSKPYAFWYVITGQKRCSVGSIYLTRNNEIGVFIAKRFQGKGWATRAILALMELHPQPRYLANIAPDNAASQRLFSALTFREIQRTYEFAP